MAVTVKNTILQDGEIIVLVHATAVFTATTGEEVDAIKIDTALLSPVPSTLSIQRIWYSCSLPGTFLEFDGATDAMAWHFPDNASDYVDFRPTGGLKNIATTPTGHITLTTLGTAAAGDAYSIIIEARKVQ